MKQSQLINDVVKALSEYLRSVVDATYDRKRPGLQWNGPEGITTRSCGAFREWAIFAAKGRLAVVADGYRAQRGDPTGGLFVLVGDGYFVFPQDASCGYHSLALEASKGAKLVNVTNEKGDWTADLAVIAKELQDAKSRCDEAAKKYDKDKWAKKQQERQEELESAKHQYSS